MFGSEVHEPTNIIHQHDHEIMWTIGLMFTNCLVAHN
jgi:hypothetical protein